MHMASVVLSMRRGLVLLYGPVGSMRLVGRQVRGGVRGLVIVMVMLTTVGSSPARVERYGEIPKTTTNKFLV